MRRTHLLTMLCILIGCSNSIVSSKSDHENLGWQATDFFSDEDVIALCQAIENRDAAEIKQLLDSGVNVNTIGKDGMTPLLWAFPGRRIERFVILLNAGADPGVVVESDFKTKGVIRVGTTVAHLCARYKQPEHFRAIIKHRVDPNLMGSSPIPDEEENLFDAVLFGYGENKLERIQGLIALGPDQSRLDKAAEHATGSSEFEIALLLFKAGANPKKYSESGTIVHKVVTAERHSKSHPKQRVLYLQLVEWLVVHGEDVEMAKKDVQRWDKERMELGPDKAAGKRR